ncbi:MAG TPA: tetratricopeptide repeat protein [Candidatus Obscuribacterales bacterium]
MSHESAKHYADLAKDNPARAAYHYNLGACFQMQKKFDDALSEYRTAISQETDLKNRNKYQEAFDGCLKLKAEPITASAVQLHKKASEAAIGSDTAADLYSRAIDLYKQAASVQPNNAPLWFNLASALYARQDFPNAHNAYQKAYKLDPKGQTDNLYWMAVIDEHFSKGAEALSKYNKYLATSHGEGKYQTEAKARIAELQRDPNKTRTIKSLQQMAKERDAEDCYQRALSLAQQNKVEEAIAAAEKAVVAASTDARCIAFLASLHQQKGNCHEAVRLYTEAEAKDPSNGKIYKTAIAEACYAKAIKLQSERRYDEAIKQYLRALENNSGNAAYCYSLATCYDNQGDLDSANELYKRTLSLDEKNKDAKTYLESAAVRRSQQLVDKAIKKQTDSTKPDISGAISLYERAIRIKENAVIHLNLGTARQALNTKEDNLKAEQSYRKALQLDPNPAVTGECYYDLGILYEALNQPEHAIAEYKKYMQALPSGPNVEALKERLKILTGMAGGAR